MMQTNITDLEQIILLVLMGAAIWIMLQGIRQKREWFKKDNIQRAIYTFGLLAILLLTVIFVGLELIDN